MAGHLQGMDLGNVNAKEVQSLSVRQTESDKRCGFAGCGCCAVGVLELRAARQTRASIPAQQRLLHGHVIQIRPPLQSRHDPSPRDH